MTLGWAPVLDSLLQKLEEKTGQRFTHIVHPSFVRADISVRPEYCFLYHSHTESLPEPDLGLLASLEQPGVPTVHNMILGDRIVSKVAYQEALRWATFLARKFGEIYEKHLPDVVIAAFDGIHSSVSLAVARRMGIPWYATNFSVLPSGYACFVDQMNPASPVQLADADDSSLTSLAAETIRKIKNRNLKARAYITPSWLSLVTNLKKLPARIRKVRKMWPNKKKRRVLQFTHAQTDLSLVAALAHLRRMHLARCACTSVKLIKDPPSQPFILFGLHMQPESSIDVWAPWVSNQQWVIEWLARSIPPSHKLLVKIHKSDAANYSAGILAKISSLPGVQLVHPFSDATRFVQSADLVVAIQGTMGLEAGLLGKPVIMLANSRAILLPSVSRCNGIEELASLIRRKIAETSPSQDLIIKKFSEYLRPYMPALDNDWDKIPNEQEVRNFAKMFLALQAYLQQNPKCSKLVS